MKEIFKTIGVLSENRVTVLIEGETGTGKELIARAIHYNSPFQGASLPDDRLLHPGGIPFGKRTFRP